VPKPGPWSPWGHQTTLHKGRLFFYRDGLSIPSRYRCQNRGHGPRGGKKRLCIRVVYFFIEMAFQYHRGTGAKTGAMVPVGAPERLCITGVVYFFIEMAFQYHRGTGAKTGAMVPVGAPERLCIRVVYFSIPSRYRCQNRGHGPRGGKKRLCIRVVYFFIEMAFQYHRGTGAKTGAMVPVGAPERLCIFCRDGLSIPSRYRCQNRGHGPGGGKKRLCIRVVYFFIEMAFQYHRGTGAKTGAMVPVGVKRNAALA
jgi:hypothetical protein